MNDAPKKQILGFLGVIMLVVCLFIAESNSVFAIDTPTPSPTLNSMTPTPLLFQTSQPPTSQVSNVTSKVDDFNIVSSFCVQLVVGFVVAIATAFMTYWFTIKAKKIEASRPSEEFGVVQKYIDTTIKYALLRKDNNLVEGSDLIEEFIQAGQAYRSGRRDLSTAYDALDENTLEKLEEFMKKTKLYLEFGGTATALSSEACSDLIQSAKDVKDSIRKLKSS